MVKFGIIAASIVGACTPMSVAQVEMANANFARDVYASRASILIIGDSTNNPRGSGTYVPYYEAIIQALPEDIDLCGFRVSGSAGNTGVNGYIRFNGGSVSQMVGGRVSQRAPDVPVHGSDIAPPGYRNEFTMIDNGVLSSAGRFASVGLTNLDGVYSNADEWVSGTTIVLRTPFFVNDNATTLDSFSIIKLTDHDGTAGTNVGAFESGIHKYVPLDTDRTGLQAVDAQFINPQTTRIGVRFSGDVDTDDANEAGKTIAWTDHMLFDLDQAVQDHGFYLDSVSIGGYTPKDHMDSLDKGMLSEYLRVMPRQANTLIVWLGQNSELDEWTGVLHPVWTQRIESIVDTALQAAHDAGISTPPTPILITPPGADVFYPDSRFTAMNAALGEIATRRGWGHIDLQTLLGNSLIKIGPDMLGPGPHPSQAGALLVVNKLYEHLDCLRAEYTGDHVRDFFDVSAFLDLFTKGDNQADLTGDGVFDFFDVSAFLDAFNAACP